MATQELINKFFRNECNADERRLVLEHFEKNPGEWNKYLDEEEWEQFEAPGKMNPFVSKKLFDKISRNTFKKSSASNKYKWMAIAASVVLLFGLGWFLLNDRTGKEGDVAKTDVPSSTSRQLQVMMNTTGKDLTVSLEDGSTVELEPGSSIKYHKPFVEEHRRIIYLEGKALFKVAKDKTKPFTVYSEAIATTALGTSFTIKSYDKNDEISVALHEGKVVVRAADPVHKKLADELFLLPGDELIYNKKTMRATVKHNASGEQMVKTKSVWIKGGTVQRPDWYKFNGLPLSEVFDQLSAYYQVDIYYYPSDIKNKYFAGKIEKTDSLENILNDIALLNLLEITKKNGSYIINKIH